MPISLGGDFFLKINYGSMFSFNFGGINIYFTPNRPSMYVVNYMGI